MDFSSSSSSSLYKALANPPISGDGIAAAPAGGGERERMFEKVVTPSDVGKLNRLVIPKQHAEKYFPLDAAAGEKGLLLNFEECRSAGKSWRFRYSYWSSSQSYVITKGWSRFVKDKKLDAGDVVSFFRTFAAADDEHSVNGARLFIDWTRRRKPADRTTATLQFHHGFSLNPWPYTYSPATPPAPILGLRPFPPYHHHRPPVFQPPHPPPIHYYTGGPVICQVGSLAGVGPTPPEPLPSKRLRLFGVNMDCPKEEDYNDVVPFPSSSTPNPTINFLGKGSFDFDH